MIKVSEMNKWELLVHVKLNQFDKKEYLNQMIQYPLHVLKMLFVKLTSSLSSVFILIIAFAFIRVKLSNIPNKKYIFLHTCAQWQLWQ